MKLKNILQKKLIKMWLFLIFLLFPFSTFASTWTISVSKNPVDANSDFELIIKIQWESREFWFINFTWIDDFDIVSKRQSSSVRIINWKIASSLSLFLKLSPRKSWEFILWPILITDWENQFKTNLIKVKITWEKFFVNQPRPISIQNKIKKPKEKKEEVEFKEIEKIEDFELNVVKKEFSDDNEKYLLFFTLIAWCIYYFWRKM